MLPSTLQDALKGAALRAPGGLSAEAPALIPRVPSPSRTLGVESAWKGGIAGGRSGVSLRRAALLPARHGRPPLQGKRQGVDPPYTGVGPAPPWPVGGPGRGRSFRRRGPQSLGDSGCCLPGRHDPAERERTVRGSDSKTVTAPTAIPDKKDPTVQLRRSRAWSPGPPHGPPMAAGATRTSHAQRRTARGKAPRQADQGRVCCKTKCGSTSAGW